MCINDLPCKFLISVFWLYGTLQRPAKPYGSVRVILVAWLVDLWYL